MVIPIGTIEEVAKHDVCLMVDRNTAAGVLEKGFHISENKVYQLHPNAPHQLYLISTANSDALFIAITDNYLMNSDGDMFQFTINDDFIYKLILSIEASMSFFSCTLSSKIRSMTLGLSSSSFLVSSLIASIVI